MSPKILLLTVTEFSFEICEWLINIGHETQLDIVEDFIHPQA